MKKETKIRKITDESGEILYNFTYGTYGEILSIWHKGDDDNLSIEDINRNHPIRFLYNGALGVVTDDNTLYSMRQRYYNPEIKRFINQDILYGDAINSQSLNRYAYVQGNPINYNDPFGLSPMQILQPYLMLYHDILNVAGIIPGPIGALADMGNAFLYMLEGDSEMACKYVVQAFVTEIALPLGGNIIGSMCGANKITKILVGLGLIGMGGYSIVKSGQSFIENWKGLFNEFSKEDVNFFNVLHYCSGIISDTAGIVYGANAVAGGFTAMFGKCFVAGTKIKTEDSDKNIEDIKVGDRVYSYNPETGEEGYKTVKRTFIKESDEIVHVTITNADKSESVTIDATPGHPFYVVGYGFKYASELKIGDKLRSVSGDIYEVTDTEVEHFVIPIKVYNFEVEDWHTYAVSEVGIFVNNRTTCVNSNSNNVSLENGNELSGQWKDVNENMGDYSRKYQKQITGQEGKSWVQGEVKFDGMKEGILIDAKAKYTQFINKKTGQFYDWFKGKQGFIDQAYRQIEASEGAKIQWYFSEKETRDLVQDIFMDEGIDDIELIFEAFKEE